MTDVTPPSPPASLEEAMRGVVLADRYRIDGVLGEGGMALVFHGHHLGLDRAIAIKVLKPEFVSDAQVRARFEQEARAVSRLEHPGIVKMYDVGTAEIPGLLIPIAFLVMERLRGKELSDVLREDGPAPGPVALGWMEEMLAAVAHAHARGVVHRDLKPENVFACDMSEGDRVLKLVDFGIAKMVQPSGDAPLTQMGMIFGTPSYMSPEQATGRPVDGRTDLYSAGVIFFEMLSGAVPFASNDMMDVLRQQVREAPPELPVAAPVAAVLYRLLAKEPEDRYPDAQAALDAVREARASLSAAAPVRPSLDPTLLPDPLVATMPTAAGIHETVGASASVPRPAPPASARHEPAPGTSARLLPPQPSASPQAPATVRQLLTARGPLLVGAGVAVATLIVLGVSALSSGDDGADADVPIAVGAPASPAASSQTPAGHDADPDVEDQSAAPSLLGFLAEDPSEVWQAAVAEGPAGRASPKRAELMLRAIRLDPARLEDSAAQDFVVQELERSVVPEALLTLVLEHGKPMREAWIEALLGERPEALPHGQRHRILDVLRTQPWEPSSQAWDAAEHLCHDLWQAEQTPRPCAVYGHTLDAMAREPSASYRRSLESADPPDAGAQEDASACTGLEERRQAVLDALEDAGGDQDFIPPQYAARTKTPQRKPKKRRIGQRIRRIFR